MFAIFTSIEAAQAYCEAVQRLLLAVRPGYCADVWDIPRKHPIKNEWAVEIPPEDDTPGVVLTSDWGV